MKSWTSWRASFEEGLVTEYGELSHVGEFVLPDGISSLGRDKRCDFVIPSDPSNPDLIGHFTFGDGVLLFTPSPGIPALLEDRFLAGTARIDLTAKNSQNALLIGRLMILPLLHEDRVGLVVKSPYSPQRLDFEGLNWEAGHDRFQTVGLFTAFNESSQTATSKMARHSHRGWKQPLGQVQFTLNDAEFVFLVTLTAEGKPLVHFSDQGNGAKSFRGGRVLLLSSLSNGPVDLDFNCAVTPAWSRSPFSSWRHEAPPNAFSFSLDAGELYPHRILSAGAHI